MAGYIALVHKDEGTSYGVSFPDLPSCISAGAIVTVVQPQRMPATREVGDKRGVRATLRIGHELVCAPKAIPVTSGSARQGRHRYRDRALRPASRTHLLPQSSP